MTKEQKQEHRLARSVVAMLLVNQRAAYRHFKAFQQISESPTKEQFVSIAYSAYIEARNCAELARRYLYLVD